MRITPKNWSSFQHYKDRSPAWIKLHKHILDDYEFHCLPDASKALAPLLWLLASEYEDGIIDTTEAKLAFRLRMDERKLAESLKPLIGSGFFYLEQDASNALADCYQDAMLEKRREEEEKREEESENARATTRETEISILLRSRGCRRINPGMPILKTWADTGYSNDELNAALSCAEGRGKALTDLPSAYLDKILAGNRQDAQNSIRAGPSMVEKNAVSMQKWIDGDF